jgi:hypothetical protein
MAGMPPDVGMAYVEPEHIPDELLEAVEEVKEMLRARVQGDDKWRHPDMYEEYETERQAAEYEEVNMVAPTPEIYKHAHAFMGAVFGQDAYTPDSVGQLVDVFVPCLRIMVERGYEPEGKLWRRVGLFGVMTDIWKKFDRYWYRTWHLGIRHDDSGFDLINFTGFSLRTDPNVRWGVLGETAPPSGPSRDES